MKKGGSQLKTAIIERSETEIDRFSPNSKGEGGDDGQDVGDLGKSRVDAGMRGGRKVVLAPVRKPLRIRQESSQSQRWRKSP